MIKILFCAALLAVGWQQAWGYALLGPSLGPDAYQTPALGYNLGTFDVGAPKNIGQGYRRNDPNIYYAYDQNFLDFFGSNGVAAVDGAFGIINALTNADNLQLSTFPLNSTENFSDSALDLSDLKSYTLGAIVEQIGLAASVRYTWTLHDRFLPAGAQCSTNPAANGEEYLIVQRNYDPITQVYSSYVNGTLYSYQLDESCGTLGFFPDVITGLTIDALAFPFPVDLEASGVNGSYTPVSEATDPWGPQTLQEGYYYTGLTYDDAGGYRYLYSTNNVNVEFPTVGSQLEVTNFSLSVLQTSDVGMLFQFALTNPPTVVQAAFPNLVISSTTTNFVLESNPVVVATFSGYGEPADEPPVFTLVTNGWTFFEATNYAYVFGNIIYVHFYTNTVVHQQTVTVGPQIQAPPGAPFATNVSYQTIILTNVPSGDYYLIPPGSCGFEIHSTQLTNYFMSAFTNVIAAATNTTTGGSETISDVTYFTNDWFQYYACNLQTASTNLYQGIGGIKFIKADFDSLTGQFFNPVTNNYQMIAVINSKPVVQHLQRILTGPDILLDAADLASPNVAEIGVGFPPFIRTMTYTQDPQPPGAAPQSGPGTITDYPTTISYNDVGNVYGIGGGSVNGVNGANDAFLSTQTSLFQWASFDSTTNAAVLYPSSASIQNLENEFLVQISPSVLPDAVNGAPYSETFTSSGGSFTAPYTWSLGLDPVTLKPTSLPQGLTLSIIRRELMISSSK
jgi:hypothetical protein